MRFGKKYRPECAEKKTFGLLGICGESQTRALARQILMVYNCLLGSWAAKAN